VTFNEEDNRVLDGILAARRSTRAFAQTPIPEKGLIDAVIDAGMKAPFASVSAGDVDIFRRFYVLPRGHALLPRIHELIKEQSRLDLAGLLAEKESDPFVREHCQILEGLWGMVAEKGLPGFLDAPCFVVVAEWAGARRAERQSLAHVMENMWLKATALNLGFCLASVIESMSANAEFCKLFGLPAGRYGFHGCLMGYPKEEAGRHGPVRGSVEWL